MGNGGALTVLPGMSRLTHPGLQVRRLKAHITPQPGFNCSLTTSCGMRWRKHPLALTVAPFYR